MSSPNAPDAAALEAAAAALDTAMDERKDVIGKRWNAVARDAGLTPVHLRRIRHGETALSRHNAFAIDRALQWPTGHAWALYEDHLAADAPELRDDTEREIWSMVAVPVSLRRRYIEMYREENEPPNQTGTE